jgi:hypothetical protein
MINILPDICLSDEKFICIGELFEKGWSDVGAGKAPDAPNVYWISNDSVLCFVLDIKNLPLK